MKVKGTYSSVTRGVSQQPPADRLEGQHGEQVNMLGDPVRGNVRRNGFILDAEMVDTFVSDPGNALLDSYSYRRFSYRDAEVDHDILYRSRPRVGAVTDAHLDTIMVYDKVAEAFLPVVRPGSDAVLDLYEQEGLSSITSIGSYVLLASNGVAPSYNIEAGYENLGWKNSGAIWVRGGSYSRTFTVKAKRASDGAEFNVSYTTPQANFPGVLNLTLTPPFDAAIGTPYEQYFVNIIRAQYDTAVNQWTSMVIAAIQPSAIAAELAARLTSAGFGGWTQRASHIFNDDLSYLEVLDGGDGTFIRGVLSDVKSVDDVTDMHRLGKVIKVQPTGQQVDPYYLKAYPSTPGDSTPYQSVIWREAAGQIQRPSQVLGFGRRVGNVFYWASGPTELAALVLAQTGQTLDVPTYAESTAGDLETVRPPRFFNRRITHLAVFQDRLLVVSGSVVNASKVGEYLNFYRSSMLTVPSDDPVEMFAIGTESDTIRTSILYDGSLMLQGDKNHYSISGQTAIDAAAPAMKVIFTMDGTAWAAPVGVGKHVYVMKEDAQLGASRLLRVRAGDYQNSPDLDDQSEPLRDYINGSPAEMVALASPGIVFMRTEHYLKSKGAFPRARPWGLYIYQFLDANNNQRVWEGFGAWEWSTALGFPIGISNSISGDSIILYTVAYGTGPDGSRSRAVNVLKASARTDPTGLPYLDGLRPAADAETKGMFTPAAVEAVRDVVYTSPGAAHSYDPVPAVTDADRWEGLEDPNYTVGDGAPEVVDPDRWTGVQGWLADYTAEYPAAFADNLWTGVAYPAFIDLTAPFPRDREGKAKTMGKLTLTKLHVTTTRTAGLVGSYRDTDGETVSLDEGGEYRRIAYNRSVWVGRDTRRVQVRLAAKLWYPLTISQIEWQGNWFDTRGRM